ncbi:MAG: potassium channel family protein [Xanthobacteraceae bacterium]|jgi:hypothetical protein
MAAGSNGAIAMLRQIVLGSAVSLGNIAVHALVMALVVRAARATQSKFVSHLTLRLVAVMIATVAVLMAAHLSEIAIWSSAYALFDVATEGTDYVYFAFVNYTTLGYGDVVPVARWRLLGPMTAMNGVLLFGWSTAVIFHVLLTMVRTSRDG